MKVLKKIPKLVVAVAAVLIMAYIVVTLFNHFSVAGRIHERKAAIQQRQEVSFGNGEG